MCVCVFSFLFCSKIIFSVLFCGVLFSKCEERRRKHKLTLLDVSEIGSGLEILAGVKFS